jgi:formate dehydrogenase
MAPFRESIGQWRAPRQILVDRRRGAQPLNHPVIPIAVAAATRERKRQAPKGRTLLPQALDDVRALIGAGPWRRDLLIEYLHAIQDAHGQLGAHHLAALARLLGLAQTEVYEVASFYHHFLRGEGRAGRQHRRARRADRACV